MTPKIARKVPRKRKVRSDKGKKRSTYSVFLRKVEKGLDNFLKSPFKHRSI
tara:strand:- start:213 stop:365 length:153 start_codon:yes stop_codon:yes gene_type:complete